MIRMRRELGMTQAELARALEVALPTVGRWESWDPPKSVMLERITRFAEYRGLPMAADFRQALEKEHSGPLPSWLRLG